MLIPVRTPGPFCAWAVHLSEPVTLSKGLLFVDPYKARFRSPAVNGWCVREMKEGTRRGLPRSLCSWKDAGS